MPTVELDDETFRTVTVAARVADKTAAEVIRMAVEAYGAAAPSPRQAVDVYRVYRGERVDATFDPATRRVTIASGPLAGRAFPSPSAAGRAMVRQLNPARERVGVNGWRFWRVTETRALLDSIR
jgi:hypothetical protein